MLIVNFRTVERIPVTGDATCNQHPAIIGLVRESLYLRMMTASYPQIFASQDDNSESHP
jgi:hypothetical protein